MAGFDQQAFDAWIHDLRTTTAKQGRGYLRTKRDEFCCLGRAIEVIKPWEWEEDRYAPVYVADCSPTYLIYPLRQKLGLDILFDCHGVLEDERDELTHDIKESLHDYLIQLNDNGFSFRFIANVAASMIERFKREGKINVSSND